MEPGPGLPIEPVGKISTEDDPHSAKSCEDDGKGQAYLTQDLEGHVCVIPHLQPEPFVHNDPGDEFKSGDEHRAAKHLPPHRVLPAEHPGLDLEEDKTYAAQHKHTPVGESPEQQFKAIVQAAAHRPKKQILAYSSHGKTPPLCVLLHSLSVFYQKYSWDLFHFSQIIESLALVKGYVHILANQLLPSREMHQKVVT